VTRVVLTGATGLIGKALVGALTARGDTVLALSRNAPTAGAVLGGSGVEVLAWPAPEQAPPPPEALAGADAVINLLGEPVAQRWSPAVKQRIHDSRALGTRRLVEGLQALAPEQRPRVLVSGSATGFYGPLGDDPVDESAPAGADFLAGVVQDWEAAALAAVADGARVVLVRTGVVLARRGGALKTMLPPFRLGIGGPVASGRQYMPWIHIEDIAGAFLHCLDDDRANGPVNGVAPAPVTNREFSHALGRALHRPAVAPVPAFALKLLYGEMADVVTTGQRVIPGRLGALGYEFRHPGLDAALRDLLGKR
jgi:uncharacterized protein (TIGR01777 family)